MWLYEDLTSPQGLVIFVRQYRTYATQQDVPPIHNP